MFWDNVAPLYDFFEKFYNGKVYRKTSEVVAKEITASDEVLECACGTGAITVAIAPLCKKLIATDVSSGMLQQTAKKVKPFSHVKLMKADITSLPYQDNQFDKVVAGNIIHLLDEPNVVVKELLRVCKKGGALIIPTYINIKQGKPSVMTRLLEKAGAGFKRQFDEQTYKNFFYDAGYTDVSYHIVKGRMSCMIAVIRK